MASNTVLNNTFFAILLTLDVMHDETHQILDHLLHMQGAPIILLSHVIQYSTV